MRGFGARAISDDQKPKYVNSAQNDVYDKGRSLFGLDLARPHATKAGEVLVVEGYTDAIALHQSGIRNVVAAMGTALTEEQVGELARLAQCRDFGLRRRQFRPGGDAEGPKSRCRAGNRPQGGSPAGR